MTVEFFNVPYFIFIIVGFGFIVLMHFLLRNKSDKTKKLVIFGLLLFNFALHFLKLLFAPYNENFENGLNEIFLTNICAVSVVVFPFIFLSKSNDAKDFMFYLGVLSGGLALLIPTEALGEYVWQFDLFRFYIAHLIIIAAPLLMVTTKIHKINYRRIWKMPIYIIIYLMFIMVNQIIQSEIGLTDLRNDNFLDPNYSNPSLFWKYNESPLFLVFDIFTPEFLKTVPFGDFAGETKYLPLIWMIPSLTIYFLVLPFIISLFFEFKKIKQDVINIVLKIKKRFKHNNNN